MCCFGQEPASGPDAVAREEERPCVSESGSRECDRRGFSFLKQMGRAGPMTAIVYPLGFISWRAVRRFLLVQLS